MPGAFAHLTMVNTLANVQTLDSILGMSREIKLALGKQSRFCDLGAVSPDYPYLTPADRNSKGWANVMHYWRTADFVRNGVRHFLALHSSNLGTDGAQRCIAWLFGYTAHLVTDMTLHPVVQAKVGPYHLNALQHRICEMNQDVYIADSLLKLSIKNAEYADIIANCSDPNASGSLNPAVATLWSKVLGDIDFAQVEMPEGAEGPTAAPDPHRWHFWFAKLVDAAEEGVPFVARLAEQHGLTYPPLELVNRDFIENLSTPAGQKIVYDELFAKAQKEVMSAWAELGAALDRRNPDLFTLPNGNLDTGLVDAASDGIPLFWRTTNQ